MNYVMHFVNDKNERALLSIKLVRFIFIHQRRMFYRLGPRSIFRC